MKPFLYKLFSRCVAVGDFTPVSQQPILIGVVTTGTIWQFGRLDRTAKHLEQGINSYRVTEDLEQVMRILVATLKGAD